MFKIIGAAAAAANLLFALSIPEKKDDMLTNNKKGKVILENSIAKLYFRLFSTNPGAIRKITYGVNISTIKIIANRVTINKNKTSSANFFPLRDPLIFSFV